MTNKIPILFRADGDAKMGLGHLFRSSALAEMIREDYNCLLATTCAIPEVVQELCKSFDKVIQLENPDSFIDLPELKNSASPLIVLDGYHFRTEFQKKLIERGLDVFCIDDIHEYPFESSVVINHAGGLKPTDYKARPATQFFLGPSYALLKKPFLEAAKNRRQKIEDNNCLICFGGADPNNRTMEVLEKLREGKRIFDEIHVIIGSAYQFEEKLKALALKNKSLFIHKSLTSQEMVNVMKKCSFAICSPSTIVYEYLSVGGVVILEQIADNQKDVIRYFLQEELAFQLDDIGKLSRNVFEASILKSSKYFDGNSGNRLKKIFVQFQESKKLTIRKVAINDLLLTHEWANDSEVRSQSYNQDPIPFEKHQAWFINKINDPDSYYYILEMGKKAVAQIRFQIKNNDAVLGYLAGKEIRSKGLGTAILGKGIEELIRENSNVHRIVGYVKKSNIASQRSFEKLSFIKEETNDFPDSFKYTMIYGN